ncbi:hypothetical protein FS837_009351 [Tulasnella sp. UAMH 9824]|nr:hypothetical protein FS837_009351 [Tulasnella sp. UAMH 9824]
MPLPVSKKKVGLGRALIHKRAKDARELRESGRYMTDIAKDSSAKLHSVTQERDLDEFLNTAQLAATDFTAEKQNVRIIHTPTVASQNPFLLTSQEEQDALRKHYEHRTQLRVPRRPPWTKSITPAQLDRQEKDAILDWRRNLAQLQENENLLLTPFERNLEVWRQLWRVVERSHLVVQIVDARNPLRFRCEDLESYVNDVEGPEGEKGTGKGLRKSLLLINKSDLLTKDQRRQWADYFDSQGIQYAFFSALDAKILQEMRQAAEDAAASVTVAATTVQQDAPNNTQQSESGSEEEGEEALDPADADVAAKLTRLAVKEADEEEQAEGESAKPDSEGHEEDDEESEDEEEGEEYDRYVPRARDENEDLRTRVLSVLELEELFIRSAPELSSSWGFPSTPEFADSQGKVPPKLIVGLVGYPNVGKSSTINALLGEKKVSVSSTPGKTKHFQTIHLSSSIMLCDCPGLVFPQFATTKAELICDGVLPIDQMREYSAPVALVVKRVPPEILEATYGLTIKRKSVDEGGDGRSVTEWDFLAAYAIARGFARSSVGNPDEARAARYVLKDYVNGKLLYCQPPPGIQPEQFNETSNAEVLKRLLALRKKKAPTTRVGKMAETYIPVAPPTPGSEAISATEGSRSRALDDRFFDHSDTLSSRPFVQGGTRSGMQISRNQLYPHQNVVLNDGTVLDADQARRMAVLQQAGAMMAGNKKHHKAKKVKLRKQFIANGYD